MNTPFASTRITYETRGPAPAEAIGAIVVLHGANGSPAKSWELFENAVPQGVTVVLAQGQFPGAEPDTSVWFGIKFNEDGTREVSFDQEREARSGVAELLRAVRAAPSMEGKRLLLLGFHQGAIVAVNILLEHPELVDGVAIATARVMDEVAGACPPLDAHKGLPVIWTHGDADVALPLVQGVRGRKILSDYGCEVETYDYPGGAEIPPETAARLRQWFEQQFDLG